MHIIEQSIFENDDIVNYTSYLYNSYWYCILPKYSFGLIIYLYHYKERGYSLNYIKNHLKSMKSDLSMKKNKFDKFEHEKKDMLFKNGYFYPDNFEEHIKLLMDFNLISLEEDTFEFIYKDNKATESINYINDSVKKEIEMFKELQKVSPVINYVLSKVDNRGQCIIYKDELNNIALEYGTKVSYLLHILGEHICTTSEDGSNYILRFNVESSSFEDFRFSLNFLRGVKRN